MREDDRIIMICTSWCRSLSLSICLIQRASWASENMHLNCHSTKSEISKHKMQSFIPSGLTFSLFFLSIAHSNLVFLLSVYPLTLSVSLSTFQIHAYPYILVSLSPYLALPLPLPPPSCSSLCICPFTPPPLCLSISLSLAVYPYLLVYI